MSGPLDGPLIRAREAMRRSRVDAVIAASPGLVAFLTGHVMPANLAYPSRDARVGQPTTALVTADAVVTLGRAPSPALGETVVYPASGLGEADTAVSYGTLVGALGDLSLTRGTVAVELGQLPAAGLVAIQRAHPGLTIRPLGDLLAEAKAEKSAQEISGLEAACALVDAAHAAIRSAIAPGLTEVDIYAHAVRAMNTTAGGHVLSGCELMSGPRTVDPGGPPVPTARTVEAGDLVMSDVYPRHPNGWWGDSCSTITCGAADEALAAPWQRLMAGLEAGRECLLPGAPVRRVYEAIAAHAGDQLPYVGHSIGRDHFEEPVIRGDSDAVLPQDGVIVLEPGFSDGRRAIRLEWAYRITRDGGLPLTTFALDL